MYALGSGPLTISGSTLTGTPARRGRRGVRQKHDQPGRHRHSVDRQQYRDLRQGGGVFSYNIGAPVTISSLTISGNDGQPRRRDFAYKLNAPLTITDSTISGNTATGHHGGGFFLTNRARRGR